MTACEPVTDGITREQVAAIVSAARTLIRQHEQRSESSRFITLGEFDALFDLKMAIRAARGVSR